MHWTIQLITFARQELCRFRFGKGNSEPDSQNPTQEQAEKEIEALGVWDDFAALKLKIGVSPDTSVLVHGNDPRVDGNLVVDFDADHRFKRLDFTAG